MSDKVIKQAGEPLFSDMLWLRPENPHQRPKTLIIGGSSSGFMPTAKLYEDIKSKSAYQTRVAMPKNLEKLVGNNMDAVFVTATNSGEIAAQAKNELLAMINWAEVVVISSDLGNNSQTEVLISNLSTQIDKPTFVVGDSIALIAKQADEIVLNPNIFLISSVKEMSLFNQNSGSTVALKNSDGPFELAEKLAEASNNWSCTVIIGHESNVVCAKSGQANLTKLQLSPNWEFDLCAQALQFGKVISGKEFEAATTAAAILAKI